MNQLSKTRSTESPPSGPRHIYVWNRLVLQLAAGITNTWHRHFGAFLLLAPEAPITVDIRHHATLTTHAALVAPNTWHRLDSRSSRVATLLIGPDHPWFGYVTLALDNATAAPLDIARLTSMNIDWASLFTGDAGCDDVLQFVERSLAQFAHDEFRPHQLDAQLTAVLDILDCDEGATLSLTALASRVGISNVTLMRRFKRELGVGVREYVLWRRLMRVLPLIDGKRTLTEIAQLAGFYDQAHLTRTSRRMFDLQPSRISDLSRARIHVCNGRIAATRG